jgi:hypothetical protein
MMMENASNIATKRNAKFSLMMQNLSNNTTNRNVGFAFKVFYFLSKAVITLLFKQALSSKFFALFCFQLGT